MHSGVPAVSGQNEHIILKGFISKVRDKALNEKLFDLILLNVVIFLRCIH